jgi:lactate dehydrogenase-like 2-hydroxyacid dehydrogenase
MMARKVPHSVLMMGEIPCIEQALAGTCPVYRLWEQPDRAAFLERAGSKITVLVGCLLFGPVDAALLDRLPALEIIVSRGVGYDQIDIAAARGRDLQITNTPTAAIADTAELAVGLLIDVARGITANDRFVREGRWPTEGKGPRPSRLRGRRLGILGMGQVGRAIAARCAPFGLDIGYHSRRAHADIPHSRFESIEALASWADILLVAVAGGPDTHHLVNAAVLRLLGPQGVLVNVARGSVVDEAALVASLADGGIAAAGLDVFENEPQPHPALLAAGNVVLQSHRGGYTNEGRAELDQQTLENVLYFLRTRRGLTPIAETR